MYEAKVEHETDTLKADWQRTASLMALLANCHRNPKKSKPYKPSDFYPFAESRNVEVGIDALRAFLPPSEPDLTGKDDTDAREQ